MVKRSDHRAHVQAPDHKISGSNPLVRQCEAISAFLAMADSAFTLYFQIKKCLIRGSSVGQFFSALFTGPQLSTGTPVGCQLEYFMSECLRKLVVLQLFFILPH